MEHLELHSDCKVLSWTRRFPLCLKASGVQNRSSRICGNAICDFPLKCNSAKTDIVCLYLANFMSRIRAYEISWVSQNLNKTFSMLFIYRMEKTLCLLRYFLPILNLWRSILLFQTDNGSVKKLLLQTVLPWTFLSFQLQTIQTSPKKSERRKLKPLSCLEFLKKGSASQFFFAMPELRSWRTPHQLLFWMEIYLCDFLSAQK